VFDSVEPPANLRLTQVYFTDSSGKKVPQLSDDDADVVVARVLRTPSINAKTDLVYETGTKTIVLTGTGLKGAKSVKLFFDPPFFVDFDYDISGGQFDNGLKKDQGAPPQCIVVLLYPSTLFSVLLTRLTSFPHLP